MGFCSRKNLNLLHGNINQPFVFFQVRYIENLERQTAVGHRYA